MRTSSIMLFGALGGCCPTIANLAGAYLADWTKPPPEFGLFIGLGLVAFIGAVVSIFNGATDFKGALAAGIAAPALITSLASGAGLGENPRLLANAAAPQPAAVAPAAEPAPGGGGALASRGGEELVVTFSFAGEVPGDMEVPYALLDAGGGRLASGIVSPGAVALPRPLTAAALMVGETRVPLPGEAGRAEVRIEAGPTLAGDLVWALGGKRRYALESVSITFD